MDKLFTSPINIIVSVIMVVTGFYFLLQFLMFVLSLNIKSILKHSDRTAYGFLQNECLWKWKGGNGKIFFLKGVGYARLRRKLLSLAKDEIRYQQFLANSVLYDQCTCCVFQFNCQQKFFIKCGDCAMTKRCPEKQVKQNNNICERFKCSRWIESD